MFDAYHDHADGILRVSPRQASRFAREVAGDFNPIHDPDARRFCVPGDLLFALVLAHTGLYQRMAFRFREMVGEDCRLRIRDSGAGGLVLVDDAERVCLEVDRDGARTEDAGVVESVVRRYVAFSGRNFPHYLQPLLEREGVMFNPDRPLVIYDRMGFELDRLSLGDPSMALADSDLTVQGRRGDARLDFRFDDHGVAVGHGAKHLIVSGLRPYDAARMDAFVAEFNRRRNAS